VRRDGLERLEGTSNGRGRRDRVGFVLVTVRGLEFHVRTGGPEAGVPILLLHGFPQHGGMWDGVVPALHAAGMRTYTPDQRGYSPHTRVSDVDEYRMGNLVADAVAVLDTLELERVHVAGHDWGSVVGWHLASAHADRVRTYTALSVPHPDAVGRARHSDGGEQKQRSSYMQLFAMEGKAEQTLLENDARRLWRLFHPLSREQARSYVEPLLEPGALTGALNWYRRLERPNLGLAQVPVTYVWGDQDPAMSRTAAQACADFVAPGVDYRFVEVAGAGHWLCDEVPDLVATEILARVKA
jgi:pimeloyl-ACP methyl ester carboxylesterase